MRLYADTHVASVFPRVLFTGHQRGNSGDSGGGVFVFRTDDGSPLQLLGVNYGGNGTASLAVRLTASGMQNFIDDFLGPKDEHYPGAMVSVGGAAEVWTGEPDLPRRMESGRAGWRDPDTGDTADEVDPDGDGLRGRHDNCWGFFNPQQAVGDISLTERCTSPVSGETVELGCAARPSVFDGLGTEGTVDSDRDGVPDACDNCPGAPNPTQSDCNADAVADVNRERTASTPRLPELGDACDPTPCAEATVVAESTTTGGLIRRTTTRFDRIDVNGIIDNAPLTGLRARV